MNELNGIPCIDLEEAGTPRQQIMVSRSFGSEVTQLSDDTTKLIHAALQGLKQIYRSGYGYKKSGVLLMGLQPKGSVQTSLFDEPEDQAKSDSMMRVMDAINRKMGQGSVTVASSGVRQRWAMRRERKSPSYTTEWAELPVAG